MPGGTSHARSGREDRTERGEGSYRGGLPRDRRRDVQLRERRLEPGPNPRHPLSAQRLLPAELCAGELALKGPEHPAVPQVNQEPFAVTFGPVVQKL